MFYVCYDLCVMYRLINVSMYVFINVSMYVFINVLMYVLIYVLIYVLCMFWFMYVMLYV
jgi:hypothetical protein